MVGRVDTVTDKPATRNLGSVARPRPIVCDARGIRPAALPPQDLALRYVKAWPRKGMMVVRGERARHIAH